MEVVIPSGMGEARNALVIRAGEAAIAIAGEYGTLSEIGFALKLGRPVVGLHTWRLLREAGEADTGILYVHTPREAVERVQEAVRERRRF